jgi:LAO/AO transport system kinase
MDSQLIERFLEGDIRALSRLISIVEDGDDNPLHEISERADSKGLIVGVTGSPGSGKSTLIGQLIEISDEKVGVIAIDPSSLSSGGAFLGDRLRMGSGRAYIRSVSSRGRSSISARTFEIARLLELFGMGLILIETVGAGQREVDIAEVADLVLLVLTPESGDEIQYLKSGIIELADGVALNKCDLDGWEKTYTYLSNWYPELKIVKTKALEGEGVDELLSSLRGIADELEKKGELQKRRERRVKNWITERMKEELIAKLLDEKGKEIEELAEKVARGDLSSKEAIGRVTK